VGELFKADEDSTVECILPVDQEDDDDVAVPDLAHVSDNSQSTTDSSLYQNQ
jgi:hypothetical protein